MPNKSEEGGGEILREASEGEAFIGVLVFLAGGDGNGVVGRSGEENASQESTRM